MTPLRTSLGTIGLLVLALASPSAALVTTHIGSDSQFLALAPVVAFVGEGRIGDRGGAATFELDLGRETSAPATQAQYNWQSGTGEPFTLTYDSGTGLVTFTLGGQTLQYTATVSDSLTDVFVRTRAVNDLSDVSVGDLVLDGIYVGDTSASVGPDAIDYLWIQGGSLDDGFVLSGTATLHWTGSAPTQSRLAFQIKVGTTDKTVGIAPATWER